MALTAEHDYARQASRQCARTCGALTRVRRACRCRAHACAWCREISRILENPHVCCARHRHALRTRVSAPQARAHCPLACSVSSCSAISATAVQPSSAAHWGIGHRETRVRVRRLRTPVHTVCSTAANVLPFTAPLPPTSSAAAPRVAKTKTPRSLGDILEDSGLSTTLSPFRGVSLC